MTAWVHQDVLDAYLDEIINNVDTQHLVSTYSAADSYATVVANSLANVAVAGGNWTKAAHATTGRKATLAALTGSATATDASPADAHLVLVDSINSKVYHATDETTDQGITDGNDVDFPTYEVRITQPT